MRGWIPARSFSPKKLPALVWRSLGFIAPAAARQYLDDLIRDRVRWAREEHAKADGPLTIVGAFGLTVGIARAAQILRGGLEAAGLPIHEMDCSPVLRPMSDPAQPR